MDIDNDADNKNSNDGPTATNTPSGVTAPSQKKLSGSTMNMKFMQRKNEMQSYVNKNHHHQQQHKKQSTPIKADNNDDPMQMDMDSDSVASEEDDGPLISPLLQHQHPSILRGVEEDAPIDTSPATTSDMYGISVDIIGRRSFGGFNRSIESTWKDSYRAHREEGNSRNNNNNRNNKNKHISDEELLARYANLVKHRNNNNNNNNNGANNNNNNANEDMSRNVIGNLGDKVKPRKQQHQHRRSDPNRSGEKRKRR